MTIEGDFLAHVRETVTIMRPMPSVKPRGRASPNKQQPTRSMRIHPVTLETINEASTLLKMTRSAFMTWCSYYTALDILRQHNEYEQDQKR